MRYKIIKDEKKFKEFIDWLPELEDGEQYYISLFARSKYDSTGTLKSDKSQLGRIITTKDRLFGKVKKMEVKLGTYEIGGIPIPADTLALYIHPNPRSMKKASIKTAKMILDNLEKERYQNPKSVALNAIQVSKSRTVYVDFDVDFKEKGYGIHLKEWVSDRLGYTSDFNIIETRGGFHVLVKPNSVEEVFKKTWHQNISKNQYIDQEGDLLLPVPGCVQGDFVPKFI